MVIRIKLKVVDNKEARILAVGGAQSILVTIIILLVFVIIIIVISIIILLLLVFSEFSEHFYVLLHLVLTRIYETGVIVSTL